MGIIAKILWALLGLSEEASSFLIPFYGLQFTGLKIMYFADNCPYGYNGSPPFCYHIPTRPDYESQFGAYYDQREARVYCRSYMNSNGYLATITTQQEQDICAEIAKGAG